MSVDMALFLFAVTVGILSLIWAKVSTAQLITETKKRQRELKSSHVREDDRFSGT